MKIRMMKMRMKMVKLMMLMLMKMVKLMMLMLMKMVKLMLMVLMMKMKMMMTKMPIFRPMVPMMLMMMKMLIRPDSFGQGFLGAVWGLGPRPPSLYVVSILHEVSAAKSQLPHQLLFLVVRHLRHCPHRFRSSRRPRLCPCNRHPCRRSLGTSRGPFESKHLRAVAPFLPLLCETLQHLGRKMR
jgi:hypothetical protein